MCINMRWACATYRWEALVEVVQRSTGKSLHAQQSCCRRCRYRIPNWTPGINVEIISMHWCLCIFVDVVPTETTLRIWDAFFAGIHICICIYIKKALHPSTSPKACAVGGCKRAGSFWPSRRKLAQRMPGCMSVACAPHAFSVRVSTHIFVDEASSSMRNLRR